ncbi:hypothetical protein [Arthrobacter sp.]|uniref:hypothetical protein n=1 Tax=Arthrobacter sp. TaxID=1667 RepID=UPI002810C2C2|nr:hypothetical protein [Arthrobacter sp.]
MAHKLRPVLRVDVEMRSAVIELHGCLTVPATAALLKILARGRSLNRNLELSLDLRRALHIEPGSLANLQLPSLAADALPFHALTADLDPLGPVHVLLPPVWPTCPVERALAGHL